MQQGNLLDVMDIMGGQRRRLTGLRGLDGYLSSQSGTLNEP